MNNVVIIIPTYNESGNVVAVTNSLAKIFKKCQPYKMSILFVDDNSPDGTAKVISTLSRKYSFVHLLNNKQKGGLGHAYKKGFIVAMDKYKADILFEFDADLQHDESIIPQMLLSIERGSDLVLGSRYIKGGGIPGSWPWYRKFLSVGGNHFIRFVMGNFKVHDWTTGYRAIRANVVQDILRIMHNSAFHGYTWQIGFLVKTIAKGYKVTEVPFYFRDRTEGSSKLGPEYIFNTMRYIMKVRINEIINNRIFKFVITGGTGTLVQIIALYFYRMGLGYQLANFLSIETAIVSNFTLSNLWTFADRKLKAIQIPGKFLQFNLASAGSILIQLAIAFMGEKFIGLYSIFNIQYSILHLNVDTGMIFSIVGILIGMFWNFFAYSHFVWKKK
ncbi:glycosyltransferase family 2 protein [Candidatus Woesebacteria bacterium]|nr:glycosyltransferase family 2 protein [Candidatus Woesebacteria bacterium]